MSPVWQTIITCVISMFASVGIWNFIQFLISRKDKKNDEQKKILNAIDEIHSDITELDNKIDTNQARAKRASILQFSDDIVNHRIHSIESWNQTLENITEYLEFCGTHPKFRNERAQASIQHIRSTYAELLDQHEFATDGMEEK